MRDKVVHFLKWYWDKVIIFGLIAMGISGCLFFSGIWIGILATQSLAVYIAFYSAITLLVVHMILAVSSMLAMTVILFKNYKYSKSGRRSTDAV